MTKKFKVSLFAFLLLGGLGGLAYLSLGATSTLNNSGLTTSTFNNSLPVLTSTMSRWYTFDGQHIVGATTTDQSGNSVNSVTTGSYSYDVGKIGQGIRFTGQVGARASFITPNLNTSTIMFWIRPDTLSIPSTHRMIFTGDSSGSGATYISLQTNNVASPFVSYRIGGVQRSISSGVSSVVGQFMHVAVTWDGSFFRIYTDCVLRSSSADLSGMGALSGLSGNTAKIGAYDSNGFETLGVIDDFRIYPTALTAQEISSFCNAYSVITTSTP